MSSLTYPKVTIALITYNRPYLLKRAIDGALSQTFKDIELLIMDNGSTDETYNIIKAFSDKRIRYHRNESNSRKYANMAFDLALGDYLIITHDDDIMDPEMVATELSVLEGNSNVVAVGANTRLIDLKGSVKRSKSIRIKNDLFFKRFEFIESFYKKGVFLPMPTVMMRKEFFNKNALRFREEVGPYNDSFLWMEANTYPVMLYLLSKPLYSYTIHEGQDSKKNIIENEQKFYECVVKLVKKYNLNYLMKDINSRYFKNILSSILAMEKNNFLRKNILNNYCMALDFNMRDIYFYLKILFLLYKKSPTTVYYVLNIYKSIKDSVNNFL